MKIAIYKYKNRKCLNFTWKYYDETNFQPGIHHWKQIKQIFTLENRENGRNIHL